MIKKVAGACRIRWDVHVKPKAAVYRDCFFRQLTTPAPPRHAAAPRLGVASYRAEEVSDLATAGASTYPNPAAQCVHRHRRTRTRTAAKLATELPASTGPLLVDDTVYRAQGHGFPLRPVSDSELEEYQGNARWLGYWY
ncbi:hypothetical protein J6590_006193 [Homalodisca vitripennis]|nr:hypothetical protein J6590_006193 [Homalodisca vitripennis]